MTQQTALPFDLSAHFTTSPFGDEPITALIADDEPNIALHIRKMLAAVAPEITVVSVTHEGEQTLREIEQHKPTLAFLDIHMPGINGIEVALRAREITDIIFITAHEQHAVAAFDQGAVDYILKPTSPERLQRAIRRFYERRQAKNSAIRRNFIKLLRVNMHPKQTPTHISESEILHIEAHGNYCRVHTIDGGQGELRCPLSQLKDNLNPAHFVQIHRGCIVNTRCIRRVIRQGHGAVVHLRNHAEALRASRQYVPALLSIVDVEIQ